MSQFAELVGCPNCGNEHWLPPGLAGFRCGYCGAHVGFCRPEPYYRPPGKRPPIPAGRKPRPVNPPPLVRPVNPPPLVRVSSNKRAVLCGISYKNIESVKELKGCINDVSNMKFMLTNRFNFPEDSIIVLTENETDSKRIPTKRNMQRWMRWLVQDCQPGDSLVFHFSGHGSQQLEECKGEEVDGYDETLVPLDFETEGMIVDNEINETLVRPLPPGVRLHAIIDACHSGTVLDLPYVYVFKPGLGKCVWEDHRPRNGAWKGTSGGEVISFSGCADDQKSADTKEPQLSSSYPFDVDEKPFYL